MTTKDLSRTTFTRFTSFWVGPRLGGVEEIAFEMFYADRWRFFDPRNAPSTCAAPQTLAWSAIYCQSPSPLICNSCMCFLVTIATHPVLVHVLLAITIDTRFKYSFLACNLNQRWNATWSTSSWGNSTHREETWTSSNLARSVNYSRSWGRDRARHGRANNGRQGGWPRDPKKNMTWKSKVKYNSRRQSSWKSIDSTNETNKNQTRRACNQVLETKKKADAKRRGESILLGWTFKSDKKVWPDHVLPSPIAESTQPRINWSENVGREKSDKSTPVNLGLSGHKIEE